MQVTVQLTSTGDSTIHRRTCWVHTKVPVRAGVVAAAVVVAVVVVDKALDKG